MTSNKDLRVAVKAINDALETTWTEDEWQNGKKIDILGDWHSYAKELLTRYRSVGWDIRYHVEMSSMYGRSDYWVFRQPLSFKACPPELRTTGT